jgi:hypothetical protein
MWPCALAYLPRSVDDTNTSAFVRALVVGFCANSIRAFEY